MGLLTVCEPLATLARISNSDAAFFDASLGGAYGLGIRGFADRVTLYL